jgi:hypothetical protein
MRQWYEEELGWACAPPPSAGVRLLTGLRFDVLELPADPGFAVLRRLRPTCPVALVGGVMRLLVTVGGAEELPGLLEWLEWGSLPLELRAIGVGGRVEAPPPPGWPLPPVPDWKPAGVRQGVRRAEGAGERTGRQGAAVWLRPPEPGCEVEPTLPGLPSLTALACGVTAPADGQYRPVRAPDLVRLVKTAATECHRFRLRKRPRQRCASS